ncbi:MAG: sulfotransferase family protein [Solirubrobacteraceae bacterium]
MQWKGAINRGLVRTTGYELRQSAASVAARRRRRAPGGQPGDRLLHAPVFVMCSVRSGSTLLRVLLDSHSRIHAPQELHLRDLTVKVKTDYAAKALGEIGLDDEHMRFLLWDRLLQRELASSGKEILVNKTPNDVFVSELIARCWSDARFIYLLRHPGAIARSRQQTRPQDSSDRNARMVLRYGNAIEEARAARPGITVRYEELAEDPRGATRRICTFLGVPWESSMLEYGRFDHGRLKPGLGDWKEKIKSGAVQPPEPPPPLEEIHPSLHELCVAWGYAPAPAPAVQPAT